jgi:signal transduction histidine kinase
METTHNDERVLIWAAGRDGELTREFLDRRGFPAKTATDSSELCRHIGVGAGALILAEENLQRPDTAELRQLLKAQLAWSDLPVVVVAGNTFRDLDLQRIFEEYGNVSILHRPLSLDTLFSTVGAALRARRRQYQIRNLLNQLKEIDRRRSEFLAMLAHELRNPLAPIRTGLQALRLADSRAVAERVQNVMERQITNLSRLIDDLLEVTRVTQGKIQLRKTIVSLQDALANAVEGRARLAAEKNISLHLQPLTQPIWLEADATRLDQVLDNILSNAIKFTPDGGTIELAAASQGSMASIRVRDSGVGIEPEMLESVFDLFTQSQQSLDRTQGGLGIGLTVVKTLVELHGGTVRAVSPGRNRGTEISIRWPTLLVKAA